MLKFFTYVFLGFLGCLNVQAQQPEPWSPMAEFSDLTGNIWRPYSRVTVEKGTVVRMTGPEEIRADEFVLDGKIVTNGFDLRIETRHFIRRGEIVAFDDEAERVKKPFSGPPRHVGGGGDNGAPLEVVFDWAWVEGGRIGNGVTQADADSRAAAALAGLSLLGWMNHDDQEKFKKEFAKQLLAAGNRAGRPGFSGFTREEIDADLSLQAMSAGKQAVNPIVIFAERISCPDLLEGVPCSIAISGKGQAGLKGQPGSQGGKGGQGVKGGEGGGGIAGSGIFGSNGKDGGRGGTGGRGGRGGDGGEGGRAVQIRLLVGNGSSDIDLTKLVSVPGIGGNAGDGGPPGSGGTGGEGGEGGGWLTNRDRGAKGKAGPHPSPKDFGPGKAGPTGPNFIDGDPSKNVVLTDLSDLADKRLSVIRAWFDFHWIRSLLFLLNDSMRVAAQLEISRDQMESRLAETNPELWQQLKDSLVQTFAGQVSALWETDIVEPIRSTLAQSDLEDTERQRLEWTQDIANRMVDLLRPEVLRNFDVTGFRNELGRVQTDVDVRFNALLRGAIVNCVQYNRLKQQRLDERPDQTGETIFSQYKGITSVFDVPVCRRDPDFTQAENVDKPIRIVNVTTRDPINLSQPGWGKLEWIGKETLPTDRPLVSSIKSLFRFLFPDAYAQDAQSTDLKVYIIGDLPYSKKRFERVFPRRFNRNIETGDWVGYALHDLEHTTLSELSRAIDVFAYLSGVIK